VLTLGTIKKITVSVAILVIAGLIMLFLTEAYTEYAEVGYQLHGSSYLDLNLQSSIQIDLNLENTGKIGAVPISKIHVLNGTITQMSINGVPEIQLSKFCWFNETYAIIENLTITKERTLSMWGTIHVIPNEGVQSFAVYADVTLASDWFHPRNSVHIVIPRELIYNRTSINGYTLLG
jgi:hypothetical protein